MLKNTILCLLLVFGLSTAYAQTQVSGGIYNNTTWSLSGSPYVVTGNIVVFPGKTLTIEPGVDVRVQGTASFGNTGHYLEVRGTLNVVGTMSAPITFKSDAPTTDDFTWAGILIKTSQGGIGNFAYANIENAYQGWVSDGYVVGTGVQVLENCTFKDNYIAYQPWFNTKFVNCEFTGNGIAVQPLSNYGVGVEFLRCNFVGNEVALTYCYDTVTIDSCVFFQNVNPLISFLEGSVKNSLFDGNNVAFNGYGGIVEGCEFINNASAITNFQAGSITNCVIRNNQVGIELLPGGNLQNNEISNNVIGVKIYDNNGNFTGNRICSNTQFNVENAADKNISLIGNCFCESDSTVAEALLFDGYDDITRGLFNFALYDSTCTNIVQLVSKVFIPTGIAQSIDNPISVFPNPVSDVLQVRLPDGIYNGEIKLVNLQGQIIRSIEATALTRIEVADLPAGVYLLEYQGPARQVVRWIKE